MASCQVILEFNAKPDCVEKVREWLKSVLPDTRSFDGCVTLHVIQNQEDPTGIAIIEQWDSRQHYERYLAWRGERGDMEVFGAMMAGPPNIRFFDYFRV
ncbi:MAG: antibiotic biosynthesis monooxygenase [Gammaproteobacteria bacterium]|nr:antibiotic biosynthesis monooxygenase [Gammaproteobacteria bacterium]